MRNIRGIELLKAVIHILDCSMEEPVLNDSEVNLNEETYEFLAKHIMRSSSDEEAKCALFNEGDNIIKGLAESTIENPENFLENSKEIARYFFRTMKSKPGIPSGDLVVCLFNCEYGITLGLLKLDYNKTYIHSIDYVEDKMVISILPQMIGLPGAGQKLQKCAFINLNNRECEILIIDKQTKKESEEAGEIYPLSELLNCSTLSDKRDVTKNLIKTSEKWIRENIKDDASTAEKVRSVLSKTMIADEVINVETMAQDAFDNQEELKGKYLEMVRDIGIEEREVAIDRSWAEKKLKRKKLKIDKDIDIYIDSNAYEDDERFEIKRNGDGTINIIIKHVRNYMEKQ